MSGKVPDKGPTTSRDMIKKCVDMKKKIDSYSYSRKKFPDGFLFRFPRLSLVVSFFGALRSGNPQIYLYALASISSRRNEMKVFPLDEM
ncbi:hypothetical protein CDAR_257421 [Caerostris darwini]|uniref:Uncharacterized protein n=1 Tax=Caerostris darwini TaxID=1538125 RepID=A0AAV4TAL2_9ARAC|nr:hypothetical protein CDAR_257421 [Caerostris darwini]